MKNRRAAIKDILLRLDQLEDQRQVDYSATHKYLVLNDNIFTIMNRSIEHSVSRSRAMTSLNRYFRYVAKQFFGTSTVKRSTADTLPLKFEKLVNIIIISFNAFSVAEGATNRCILTTQMASTGRILRQLFLTMGVELRTAENKKKRISSGRSSSSDQHSPDAPGDASSRQHSQGYASPGRSSSGQPSPDQSSPGRSSSGQQSSSFNFAEYSHF